MIDKKKILVVDFNGTSPTYTYYFVKGLIDAGMYVKVLGKKNNRFIDVHNYQEKYLGLNSRYKYLNYLLNWIYLFFLSKKYKAIHFQWLPMLNYSGVEFFLVKILKSFNSNIFYTIHNFYPHGCNDDLIKKRYIRLYNLMDNFIIHTQSTKEKFVKNIFIKKNFILINHGLFYSEFSSLITKQEGINLLILGHIMPYKGVEDAISAVRIILNKGIKINLRIKGKCNKKYYLKLIKHIAKLKVSKNVIITDYFIEVDELIQSYKESSLCIMPYREIEQSGVLYTSIGLGIPVVSYDVGGISEKITHRINGSIVPRNNIEKLAQEVEWCYSNLAILKQNISDEQDIDYWKKNGDELMKVY